MHWVTAFRNFTKDTARLIQFFMICRQLGIILSSVVLAWLLPVNDVGVIELLMFVGYLMTFFWSDALLRGYLAKTSSQIQQERVTSFFLLFVITSLAAMMVLLLFRHLLIPIFTSRPDLDGLEIFALYQVLVLPLWISPFIGVLKGQNILLAAMYVLIGPAFACWTGFTSLPGITGILLGLFCYALVGFAWLLTNTRLLVKINIRNILVEIWPYTWPLTLYAISLGLARSFDAWLVARHFDESIFAIFRYGAREFPLVVALSAGVSAIMIPKLRSDQSLYELKHRSTRLMHSSYPLIAVLMLSSGFLFKTVYGEEYIPGAIIFNIYLLLTLTQLFFPQSIITARGDTRMLWYISLAELAVNIIASVLLLKWLGLSGIAWGTLIAFAFEKLALLYFIKRKYGINASLIFNPKILAAYSILLSLLFILSAWLTGH